MKIQQEKQNILKSSGRIVGNIGLTITGLAATAAITLAIGGIFFPPALIFAAAAGGVAITGLAVAAIGGGMLYGFGAAYDAVKNQVSNKVAPDLNSSILEQIETARDPAINTAAMGGSNGRRVHNLDNTPSSDQTIAASNSRDYSPRTSQPTNGVIIG